MSDFHISFEPEEPLANFEIGVPGPSGPAGPTGPAGPNTITSATTSDGTGNISLNTLEVLGTLTANHIHGNIAGSVYAHVRAGEALAKGDPVYVSGSHGSGSTLIPIVSKADAANPAKMPAVGVMDAAVAANANGHMVITGTITEFNTNAYSLNAELYVANGGGLTATPPAASSQPVGRVERVNANNGAFIVKVNGWASSGGNGTADANKLVRFGSAGTIPISSVAGSRSGIDSRTSFPNDDVTAATSAAIANTLVKRDSQNAATIAFLTSATIRAGSNDDTEDAIVGNAVNATGVTGRTIDVAGVQGTAQGTGYGVYADSQQGTAIAAVSGGTNHAEFGDSGNNRSFIRRVLGLIGWHRGSFTQTLGSPATLTANRVNTLPDADGALVVTGDSRLADVTDATSDATPNTIVKRSASGEVQIDTVTAGTVQSEILYSSTGLTSEGSTQIVGSLALNGTTFTYGTGSASAHRTALGLGTAATANSSAFATASHTHGNISNTGAIGTTADLAVVTGASGALTVTSRSGIDSRTSFPNADVTAATSAAIGSALVRRDTDGSAVFTEISGSEIYAGNLISTVNYYSTGNVWFESGTTFTYGAGSASAHRTALGLTSLATTTAGTGVTTALAVNVGTSGAFVVNGGALGTPSSGTLTNCSGLPISGVTNLQTTLDSKANISNPVRTTLTGNGTQTVFAISGAGSLSNPSALIVAIDGALQEPSVDYTVGGGNITFTDPLASGAKAVVIAPSNSIQVGELIPSDGSVTSAKLAPNLTLTSPSIAGTAQFTGTSRPTSAATGSPAATDLITRADGVNETIFNMARIQRSDHAQSYTANGGTSNLVDGDNFATGTAANNRPVCVRYRQINRFGSGQLPTVCPIRIASFLAFAHPGSLNAGGRLRCAIGMASGASVPAGDANALNGRGFGWEIFWDGSNIVFGLFAHDGTNYVRNDGISGRQAPVPIGQPPSNFDVFSHIIVGLNSSGVVSAQAIFVNNPTAPMRVPESPVITLAGGPTSGNFSTAGVQWAAVNHSTNAATQQITAKIFDRLLIFD